MLTYSLYHILEFSLILKRERTIRTNSAVLLKQTFTPRTITLHTTLLSAVERSCEYAAQFWWCLKVAKDNNNCVYICCLPPVQCEQSDSRCVGIFGDSQNIIKSHQGVLEYRDIFPYRFSLLRLLLNM